MAIAEIKLSQKSGLSPAGLKVLGDNIGVLWESRIQKAFREGGYDDEKWKPSMVPNIGRIFQLLNSRTVNKNNQRLKDATKGNQKTLFDTGALMKSFTWDTTVDDKGVKVNIGTITSYAPNLHYGIPSVIPITETALKNIKTLIKEPDYKFLASFLKKRQFTIKPHKRSLISFDSTMKAYMKEAFDQWRKHTNEEGK